MSIIRVAYITDYDTGNPNLRSGVPFFICQALKAQGYIVSEIKVRDQRTVFQKLVSRFWQWYFAILLKGKKGLWDPWQTTAFTRSYLGCREQASIQNNDLVLAINPSLVAWLPGDTPLALFIDNSFDTYCMYPGVDNYSKKGKKEALCIEAKAFARADRIFVASQWLKEYLSPVYPTFSHKFLVMPRGANLVGKPGLDWLAGALVKRRESASLNLLFISSSWERKGGSLTLEVFETIAKNQQVSLTIIGQIPLAVEKNISNRTNINWLGVLDKQDINQLALYREAMATAHFLLVPSKADGFGNIYAEAACHGLPSVALAVMGVTEAVKQGITGWLLPAEASVETIAAFILQKWTNTEEYIKVCNEAYAYGTRHFDWQHNLEQIIDQTMSIHAA